MATNLKTLANKYEAFDGAVTFYMIGYRTLQTDQCIQRLEAVEPQFEYVHAQTGERVTVEPDAYRTAVENAEATGLDMIPSAWTRNRLWSTEHDIFWLCTPLTVEIEFRLTDKSPAAAKALRSFWQNRNGSVANNWTLWCQLLPVQTLTVWLEAYNATRDEDMAAPVELQQGEPDKALDPNAGGGGTNSSAD